MSTKTRSDLITEVLDRLGVLASGQTPSSEDVAKVDGKIDAALATLSETEIYTVDDSGEEGPSGGEFTLSAFLPLANIVANACAAAFGLLDDQNIEARAKQAERTLLTLARPDRARKTLRTDAQLMGRRMWPGRGSYTNGT